MDSKGQNQCTLKGIFGGKTQKFEQIWKPAPIYICPICQNSVLDSDIQYICKYEGKKQICWSFFNQNESWTVYLYFLFMLNMKTYWILNPGNLFWLQTLKCTLKEQSLMHMCSI